MGSIGEIRTQNVTADDVTERVVDLESRISTAEASVERLKGFLEEATDIETIAELEAQLLQRETDLETMRGSLRTLQDRVDLATIYLTLTEALAFPDLQLIVSGFPGHDDGISCPAEGRIRVEEGEDATVCFEIINCRTIRVQVLSGPKPLSVHGAARYERLIGTDFTSGKIITLSIITRVLNRVAGARSVRFKTLRKEKFHFPNCS